jgi:hypothetical protein
LAAFKQNITQPMKKMLILALAALPLFGIAQDKEKQGTTTTTAPAKTQENKFAIENPEVIFVELVVSTAPNGTTAIRADFGREILTALSDKDLVKQLTELRSMSFPSMPDAMNYLANQGFKFQQNYTFSDKDGKQENHFVFEKRMPRKGAADGSAKPNRPERPEGTKPSTETKPADKTPSAKPVEKPKK